MTRPCPACDAAGPYALRGVDGKVTIAGTPLTIATCHRCGAQFQPQVPTQEELSRWYEYMGHNPANVTATPLLVRRLDRIVALFAAARRTGRLLEIGCGGGLFVRAATAAGWEVWGTEISDSCAAVLAPMLGPRLHRGSIADAPFAAESFDGIAMIEVLEHLDVPSDYLTAAHRLLRPGGTLVLTTPNARGGAGRLLGTRWRNFADEHLNYFDRRSLTRLLERCGFGDLRIATTNLSLIAVAAELRHRLRSRNRRAAPPSGDSPAPPPLRDTIADPGARLRAYVADLSIEAVNRIARLTRLGDTLKVVARRG